MRSAPWMKKSLLGGMCLTLLVGMVAPYALAQDDPAPKHTIKEVMKAAHDKTNGVLGKVLGGTASDDDKKALLDLYISLVESKPAKGDMASWHMLAGKAATAAAKVVVGREGATEELKAATTCAACHKLHK